LFREQRIRKDIEVMKSGTPPVKIAPSILSADFSDLRKAVANIERGGADWIHIDVMDGHFVPNISFGPVVIRSIRSLTKLPLDTHLMIEDPDRYLQDFKNAGCDTITVHVETCRHLHRTIQRIRELGMSPGVTLNPATRASVLKEILPYVDLVLVMTVNPGFGGQQFIPTMTQKILEVSELIREFNPAAVLEVDGGVDERNAGEIVAAGATILVAGNAIFSQKNIPQAIQRLRSAAVTVHRR
jgi:ribulose-phosphate 3-epimerase